MSQLKAVKGPANSEEPESPSEKVEQRKAKELVIGFCGPVGSGVHDLADTFINDLETPYQYECHHIRLSDVIQTVSGEIHFSNNYERFDKLQDAGNLLRATRTTILAEYAVAKIRAIKGVVQGEPSIANKKRAFIIDQLKHPDEIKLLKKIYGNSFYLIGVLATKEERVTRLNRQYEINDGNARNLLKRDEHDTVPHGQKVRDSLQHADFFVRHGLNRGPECKESIQRFIRLMLGMPIVTPTVEEYAMYEAHTASLRSSCLSRQVGASIIDQSDHLISTGYNDVPKYEGGLYGNDISTDRSCFRCFEKEEERCFNDLHKQKIYNDISKKVADALNIPDKKNEIEECLKETKIKNLLEFSRSIHAEMESILSAGRQGKSVVGSRLFCTTFPCHNCARHIIAAGIESVYFIEPYEKSLALDLHDDALSMRSDAKAHVKLFHFEGVSPTKFSDLFKMHSERKEEDGSGRVKKVNSGEAIPVIAEYLDSRVDYETYIIQNLKKEDEEATTRVLS